MKGGNTSILIPQTSLSLVNLLKPEKKQLSMGMKKNLIDDQSQQEKDKWNNFV